MTRCSWCNENNPLYVNYHDNEWGQPKFEDSYLFEILILESFQAGLSWECVLNKRENFRIAFDNFNIEKIISYSDAKIHQLTQNKGIIRNKLKINSTITNAKIFKKIQLEFGTFFNYLKTFWNGETIFDSVSTRTQLSDSLSIDLQKRGMKFVGSVIIQSFLQAVGIVNAHEPNCFKHHFCKN